MKIKVVFLMIVMTCGSLSVVKGDVLSFDYEPVAICLGNVVFPKGIDPDLNVYYKGKKLSIDVHSKEKEVRFIPYSLEEKKSNQQFHMVVCSECKFASKDNTVQYLYVPSKVQYKFYTLTAARSYNEDKEVDGYLWTCTQEQLLDDNIIPDNTVIFLFNADYVECLNVKSWPQSNSARILPEIVIKKSVEQEELSRAVVMARLAALDLDTIHQHNVTCIKQMNKQSVSSIKS